MMGICAFSSSWIWTLDVIGVVFSILTASTLVFRHRHLRFTATVTLLIGLGIFLATLAGPTYFMLEAGDTGGVDPIASASFRWNAFRRCFDEGGLGSVIPLVCGAIGIAVARVDRLRSEPPRPIPAALEYHGARRVILPALRTSDHL